MKNLKAILLDFPNNDDNLIVKIRRMFDSNLITYSEYIVLREYILDNNLDTITDLINKNK